MYSKQAGKCTVDKECDVYEAKLPQLTAMRSFRATFNLFEPSPDSKYDVMIGGDLMEHRELEKNNYSI